MKTAITILVAGLVSGCAASSPFSSNPPHYDYSQKALIGKGYPVERIKPPHEFEFSNRYNSKRREEHTRVTDHGSANIVEVGVAWISNDGSTATATAMHRGLSRGSMWDPWNTADGYEFVGSHRVQYQTRTGKFYDVTGDNKSIPDAAPDCAASSHLLISNATRSKQTIFTYTEGRPCDELATFSKRDASAQRQRAYRVFGIR